jgi:hypothetical protein
MQLVQNNIVNLPVFRNSYSRRSYLHSLFITRQSTSPCCLKQSHKVTWQPHNQRRLGDQSEGDGYKVKSQEAQSRRA